MKCINCNTELTDDMFKTGMCFNCGESISKAEDAYKEDQARLAEETAKLKQRQKEKNIEDETNRLNNHKMTTGYNFEGYNIVNYHGLVSGEIVLGTGYFTDLASSIYDFFGVEATDYSDKLKTAKKAAQNDMIKESVDKGGNAIIGISYEYFTFSGNMIGVSVNGTSVTIRSETEAIV